MPRNKLYSLIETEKANGIEPYAYFEALFTQLPQTSNVEEIETLLPITETAINAQRPERHRKNARLPEIERLLFLTTSNGSVTEYEAILIWVISVRYSMKTSP